MRLGSFAMESGRTNKMMLVISLARVKVGLAVGAVTG